MNQTCSVDIGSIVCLLLGIAVTK